MGEEEKKVRKYLEDYGVEAINLLMNRHDLSNEKRNWFSIRFASEDVEIEKKCTEEMQGITEKIEDIDRKLDGLEVPKKKRSTIVKDIKRYSPDGWRDGFVLEGIKGKSET